VFILVLLIIDVLCPGLAFLLALPLLVCLIAWEPTISSLSRVDPLNICVDEFLPLIVSRLREVSLLPLLVEICFLILDVVCACLLIELPIPRLLLELIRLLRPAAGCCALFGGGVLRGLITLPILEFARSLELLRFLKLPAGCFATLEGGVLFGRFTLLMIELLRLV